jgi:glycerol-3-phosphate dehydrogenase
MQQRAIARARLGDEHFDCLIIGGGIVGAGIARDAAMRGLRVALVEQGDFASGASSKTSKLIHGGLRYLEHGHFKLVQQSLRERARLRAIAPHWVTPRTILLPVYAGDRRPAWQIRFGLWLYERMARVRRSGRGGAQPQQRYGVLNPKQALYQATQLNASHLKAVGRYTDCQVDDARLCLMNILQALDFNAVCLNYTRVKALLHAKGKGCGAMVEDALDGGVTEVRATAVINATGAWSDRVRRMAHAQAEGRLAPTKGVHVLLPPFLHYGVFFEARADRRMLFLLPWQDYTLLGTTESAVDRDLHDLAAQRAEVDYLLEAVNRILQEQHFGVQDVLATFAGARPLLRYRGGAQGASREHVIEVDSTGLISVLGGKYTTYRLIAQQAVDTLMRVHRLSGRMCVTDSVLLLDANAAVIRQQWQQASLRVGEETLQRLLATYGVGTSRILQRIHERPELAEQASPQAPYLKAEFWYMAHWEWAATLEDLLLRRTHVAWGRDQGAALLPEAIHWLRQAHGYASAEVERQKQAFERAVQRDRACLAGSSI